MWWRRYQTEGIAGLEHRKLTWRDVHASHQSAGGPAGRCLATDRTTSECDAQDAPRRAGSLGSEQDHARPTPISGIVLYTLRSSGFERAGAMATGTVEWFEAERGYRSSPTTTVNDGGKNVFVRQSEIRVEGPRAGAGSSRSPRAERACEPTWYDSTDRSSVSPARFSTPPGAGLGIRPARASGPEGRRGL